MATVYDINIKKLDEKAVIPTYGSEYAAGADLYACLDEAITHRAGTDGDGSHGYSHGDT